jgi:hypothetical protein
MGSGRFEIDADPDAIGGANCPVKSGNPALRLRHFGTLMSWNRLNRFMPRTVRR